VPIRAGGGVAAPELPAGQALELPGRGTTFVRHVVSDSPLAAAMPTLLLLHGWTASADLNFFRCYRALSAEYNVLAIDHRGHGRGIRTRKILRLEHCADDAIAACEALGIERVIPVGYSMGGIIAQLVWHRHRERVAGLVLCATSGYFVRSRDERLSLLGISSLAALARLTPGQARRWLTDHFYLRSRAQRWEPWAIEEASLHEWRTVLEAGRAIGSFSSRGWIRDVDVPTAVVITMRDEVVPVRRQIRLFEMIPGAHAFRVDGEHDVVIANPGRFLPVLLQACARVAEQASRTER
jgi:3-oxoadipate enol-lactonase